MKRILFSIAALALFASMAFAQTPAPYWRTTGQFITLSSDTLATVHDSMYSTPLQFAVQANKSYWFKLHGLDSSSTNAGIKLAFHFPSGSTFTARLVGQTSSATATAYTVITADSTLSTAYETAAATNGIIDAYGTLDVGSTGGTLYVLEEKITAGNGGLKKNTALEFGRSK